jgi:hypothetical protein
MGLMDSPIINRFLPRVGQGPAMRLPQPPYEEGSPLDVGVRKYAVPGLRALGQGAGLAQVLDSLVRPGGLTQAGITGARGLGHYLTSAPERPLGDEARSMGMIETPPPAETTGHETDNPAVMGARNSPSPVDATPTSDTQFPENGMFPEYAQHAAAAAHSRPPTRAIRMPGGKFLFTNREELGGEETSVGDAGREIRGLDAAAPGNTRMAMAPRIDPTSATMSSLLRSSIRSNAGERAPGYIQGTAQPVQPFRAPGRMVAGEAPDTHGGAVSMIEGTPDQQLAQKLSDAMGATALAQSLQEQKVAGMSPEDAAALGNPQVQAGSWANRQIRPQIESAHRAAAAASAQARATIQDPKQLDKTLRDIQAAEQDAVREALATLTVLIGLRPQVL